MSTKGTVCDNSLIIPILLFGDDQPCGSYTMIATMLLRFHRVVVERIAAHGVCNSGPKEATIDFSSPLQDWLSGDKVRFPFPQDDS